MGRALIQAHINRRPHKEPEQHVIVRIYFHKFGDFVTSISFYIFYVQKAQRKVRLDESEATQIDDLDSSAQSDVDFTDDDCLEAMIFIEEANRLNITNKWVRKTTPRFF